MKLSFVLTMRIATVGLLGVSGCARSNNGFVDIAAQRPAITSAPVYRPVTSKPALPAGPTNSAPAPVIVSDPPPPPQIEVIGAPPQPNHIWIPGHWERQRHWTWISGHWAAQPRPQAVWVPGRWAKLDQGWKWVSGYWR